MLAVSFLPMLQLDLITVGDLPRGPFQEIRAMYLKYLSRFARVDHRAIKDDPQALRRVPKDNYLIILDPNGTTMTSEEFASHMGKLEDLGQKVTVLIGGANGLSDEMKSGAKLLLSLSKMTTTHDLAHLFFLEQLFRGLSIVKGTAYHK